MGSRIESSLTRDLMRMHFKWKRTKKSIFQKRYNAAASVTSELLVQLTNFFFLSEQFSAQKVKVPKDKKILNRFLERKAKCNHTSLYFFLPEIGFLGFHYYHKIIICAFKKAIFTENDFIFHIKKMVLKVACFCQFFTTYTYYRSSKILPLLNQFFS